MAEPASVREARTIDEIIGDFLPFVIAATKAKYVIEHKSNLVGDFSGFGEIRIILKSNGRRLAGNKVNLLLVQVAKL